MPPTRTSAVATRDQSSAQSHDSEPKTTKRATSVPPGRREDAKLELLQLKKQRSPLLQIEDTLPLSLPDATARGRKRTHAAHGTASTSAFVTEPSADVSEQQPQKRRKRSSSTPALSRPSRPTTQLSLSTRRSRSRLGSSTTNVECLLSSQSPARHLHKFHPLPNNRVDIYVHLAAPDGAGNLLNNPPANSPMPNSTISSQSSKITRGRRRRNTDLTDENTKLELMAEWARIRQSQGPLPLSGIGGNTCPSQAPLHENAEDDDGSVPSIQLNLISRRSPNADLPMSHTTTITNIPQSQKTLVGDSPQGPSLTRMEPENTFPVGTDTMGKNTDHRGTELPIDGGTKQLIVPIEATTTSILDSHMDGDSPTREPADDLEPAHSLDSSQPRGSRPPSPPRSRVASAHSNPTKPTTLPVAEQATPDNSQMDHHETTLPRTCAPDTDGTQLGAHEEFHMFDIPDVFTLPWVPVSSHLYVPQGLGKLISGMKAQLIIEARARRRAEELYHAELSRRVSAQKIIEDLQMALEEKQENVAR